MSVQEQDDVCMQSTSLDSTLNACLGVEAPAPRYPPRKRRPVFYDTAAAKKSIQSTIANNEKTSSADFYKTEGRAQALARSPQFEQCTLAAIALNALWIAIDLDHNKEDYIWNAEFHFIAVENMFCAFFFAEVCVRFAAYARKVDALRDPLFLFDAALVALMVSETWIFPILYFTLGLEIKGGGVLAVLRLVRLVRVVRMARLMRAFPEIMVLVKGMMVATRSVFFTLVMLLGVIYIFAIVFGNLCRGTSVEDYFSSVPWSIFNLVTVGLYMDGVYDLMDAFYSESWLLLLIFVVFLFISTHTILNLLIGVLCENVSVIAVTEKFELLVVFLRDRLILVVDNYGINPKHISKHDFLTIVSDDEAIRTFAEVDVDPVGIVDFIDIIFGGDFVSKDGTIDFPNFMEIILSFRGTNGATVKDIARMQKYLAPQFAKINLRLDRIMAAVDAESVGVSPAGGGGGALLVSGAFAERGKTASGANMAAAASVSSAWPDLRPAFEAVVRQSFAESFESSISPQLGRLNACIASISSKLEQSFDGASAQVQQLGAGGAQGSGGAQPHASVILSTLTELRDKLQHSQAEALTAAGDEDLPPSVANVYAEEAERKQSPFGLGDTANSNEQRPLPPGRTGPWRGGRAGQSPPAQDVPMLPKNS